MMELTPHQYKEGLTTPWYAEGEPMHANRMDEAGEWPHNVAARRMGVSLS
jgi:hypothetical protein